MSTQIPSSDYWRDRFTDVEGVINANAVQSADEIKETLFNARLEIDGEIEKWMNRIADNNKISYSAAQKLLNANELEEFKWNVKMYIKKGEENAQNQQWVKQLENASAKHHITRLEALKLQINQRLEVAYDDIEKSITKASKSSYKEGYYRSLFELQKGTGIGFDVAKVNDKNLDRLIKKPWASDGANFSSRIWKNKAAMVSELERELVRNCVLGKSPKESIKQMTKFVDDKVKNATFSASRLVMTETAYFSSVAQKDSFTELGVEEFEIVATLDSETSQRCRDLDGEHFPLSDFEPWVTAPPFHQFCRSTTVPWFEEEFSENKRAARDNEGKTYYIDKDLKYDEWYYKRIESNLKVEQTQKISRKSQNNEFSIDRQLLNSKKYHDKYEGLTSKKVVDEALYQEAMKILEHRDGTDFEDIVILNARDGKIIVKNDLSKKSGKTGLTKEQYNIYMSADGEKIMIHNHPNSSRFSYTDLLTIFEHSDIKHSVMVGHDGSLGIISNINRNIDIDGIYKELYNTYKQIYQSSKLANKKALDDIYDLGIFTYERR